ncbi:MAG: corrinoid protein [Pelolinea sp.]|nr:corrinoid protein [Pelolinea sp.]
MEAIINNIYQGILEGDREAVTAAVQEAINAKMTAEKILKEGMMAAMGEVGRLFEEGEYFVPELLIAARAMQGGMGLLKPMLVAEDIEPVGRIVIGTVKGDLHDIGKNLVGMMLEGAGFEVTDLGSDVDAQKFVDAVKSTNAQVVGMSALLTTTMSNMPSTIEALKAAGLRDKVKVMVGGAPLTKAYADQIGADGYAPDASQAAKLALSLVS